MVVRGVRPMPEWAAVQVSKTKLELMYMSIPIINKLIDNRKPKVYVLENMATNGFVCVFPRGEAGAAGKVTVLRLVDLRGVYVEQISGSRDFNLVADLGGGKAGRVIDTFRDRVDAEEARDLVLSKMKKSPRSAWTWTVVSVVAVAFIFGVFTGMTEDGSSRSNRRASAAKPAETAPSRNVEVAEDSKYDPSVPAWRNGAEQQPQRAESGIGDAGVWSDMAGLKALAKIKFGQGEPQFYAFIDPRCSACQSFDKVLGAAGIPHALIPIGAIDVSASVPGASAVLVAQAFCADDQPGAWKAIIGGMQVLPKGKTKDQIKACADASLGNLKYFAEKNPGGRSATPTLISKDGRVYVGGFGTPDELKAWVAGK